MTDVKWTPPQLRDDKSEGWRRIRVGATGIVAILLLIGLSSAMMSRLTDQANVSAQVAGSAGDIRAPEPVDEPLAELGVAPGAPENTPAMRPNPAR